MPIEEKMMLHAERGEIVPTRKLLKTPHQIEKIRESAKLNTAVLDEVAKHIHIGMSTAEIDDIVYRFTTEHGGIPAPLNYQGFPKSVCTSINNEICHGIPDGNEISRKGTSSTWTSPRSWTDISLMPPACSRWERFPTAQNVSSVSQRNV